MEETPETPSPGPVTMRRNSNLKLTMKDRKVSLQRTENVLFIVLYSILIVIFSEGVEQLRKAAFQV